MKVLMFGWEFPPHISGGLGTACYGITKGLASFQDIDLTFVVPKVNGDEQPIKTQLIGANQIDLIESKIDYQRFISQHHYLTVESNLVPYVTPEEFSKLEAYEVESIGSCRSGSSSKINFTGKYGAGLLSEIHNFSIVSEHIAKQNSYDVIHAHDWLTFKSGIAAKQQLNAPLFVHVHATEFDRSGGAINQEIYEMEKEGMENADCVITVSNHTRKIVIEKYHIPEEKVITVYNAIDKNKFLESIENSKYRDEKIITFLGRITQQKGPFYFIETAKLILENMKNVRFIMAGSGNLMDEAKQLVKEYDLEANFEFPGFLKGKAVYDLLTLSDVYIMPSVSEPFGISPLEAMQSGVPVIISKQSGASEVLKHAVKVDYWDTHAMADAIYNIVNRSSMNNMLRTFGKNEVDEMKWEDCAQKLRQLYKLYQQKTRFPQTSLYI